MFEFAEDQFIYGLTVADYLALAGVDLDQRNIQRWLRGGVPDQSPFYRFTGVVILVRMIYSNMRSWEFPSPQCEIKVQLVPSAWGFEGASSAEYVPSIGEVVEVVGMVRKQSCPVLQLQNCTHSDGSENCLCA